MRINQQLFSVKGFSVTLSVTDNKDTAFAQFFRFWQTGVSVNYSVYLLLTIHLDENGKRKKSMKKEEGDIYETCILSFFDMYNLKKTMVELQEFLESDYFEEYQKIDEGLSYRLKPEHKDYFPVITNSTAKNQIGFRPKFLYKRSDDSYVPVVKVVVNRDDVGVPVPVPQFLAIAECLKGIDIHSYAMNCIQANLANLALRRKVTNETRNSVEITED